MSRTRHRLGRALSLLALVVLLAAALMWWQGTRSDSTSHATAPSHHNDAELIQRGAYLAQIGNCAACHTVAHGEPFAGGRAIPTQFGTFYGSNITPDPQYGIGTWSAEDFWRALHEGKRPDGTLLYPAFPYTSYTQLSRADADALHAYLKSQPAVAQPNAAHQLGFPYNQRWLLAFWRALHFEPATFTPDLDQTPLWNRGAYLVGGLGHCAECHTPRNRLGGLQPDQALAGTLMPMADWFAPALTPSSVNGLAGWSEDDLADLLRLGHTRFGVAAGPMAEVVFDSSQHLSTADAQAMAHYLLAQNPGPQTRPEPIANRLHTQGGQLYAQNCASCHGERGEGQAPGWPALAGNLTLNLSDPVNAIRKVLDGGFAPGTAGNPQPYGMPPFRHRLSDTDIAAILSYTRNQWGNAAAPVAPNDVRRARLLAAH